MNCTRCEQTGFLNLHQVSEHVLAEFDRTGDHSLILDWIATSDDDVQICDCCGDGHDWHSEPGQHVITSHPLPECY